MLWNRKLLNYMLEDVWNASVGLFYLKYTSNHSEYWNFFWETPTYFAILCTGVLLTPKCLGRHFVAFG
jgi:hypothetical protein